MGCLCQKPVDRYSRIEINSSTRKINNDIDKFVDNIHTMYNHKHKYSYDSIKNIRYNEYGERSETGNFPLTLQHQRHNIHYKVKSNPYNDNILKIIFACKSLDLDIEVEVHSDDNNVYVANTGIRHKLIFRNKIEQSLYSTVSTWPYNIQDELCFIDYYLRTNTSSHIDKTDDNKFTFRTSEISASKHKITSYINGDFQCIVRHIHDHNKLLNLANIIHTLMDLIPI